MNKRKKSSFYFYFFGVRITCPRYRRHADRWPSCQEKKSLEFSDDDAFSEMAHLKTSLAHHAYRLPLCPPTDIHDLYWLWFYPIFKPRGAIPVGLVGIVYPECIFIRVISEFIFQIGKAYLLADIPFKIRRSHLFSPFTIGQSSTIDVRVLANVDDSFKLFRKYLNTRAGHIGVMGSSRSYVRINTIPP